jgi:Leucine-rich repeat (LRR) protein
MDWIAKLPNLESLHLDYTTVSDAGFAKLAGLTALSELYLDRTNISDASLGLLTRLRKLRYIDLYHTLFTEQGVQSLRKALPDCKINWSLDSTRRGRRT